MVDLPLRKSFALSPGPVLLAAAFAFLAALAFVGVFLIGKLGAVVVIGTVVFAVLFILVRNQRLFCLWGAVLSAPLAVSKSFVIIPHMGGAGAYTIEPLDICLVLLLAFMIRDRIRGLRPKFRWTPVGFWWGGMMAFGLVSVALGPLRQLSAEEVFRMAKCYLLFFVIVNEALRLRQIMHVVAALVVVVLIQSGAAVVQGVLHKDLGLQVLGEATQETIRYAAQATYLGAADEGFRVSGLIGHPNLLAAMLAMLLPICVALLFARIPTLSKLAVAVATALGVVALLLTLSRTGWTTFGVAFAILFGFSFVHPRLRTRFIFARVAFLAGAAAVLAAFSGTIIKRLYQSDPGALDFRFEWNHVAWDFVMSHPLFGVGLNTFVYHLPGNTKYGGIEGLNQRFGDQWPAAHNIYLLTWSEQGTLGFVFLIGLNLYLLLIGLKNTNRYVNDGVFAVNMGCVAGLVSLLIDGLTSFYIRNPAPARIFWIFAGLMVAIHYWNRANAPNGPRQRVWPIGARHQAVPQPT